MTSQVRAVVRGLGLAVAGLLLGLVLAACGGVDGGEPTAADATTSASDRPTASPAPSPTGPDAVETASATPWDDRERATIRSEPSASDDAARDDLQDVAAEAAAGLPTGVVPQRIAIPALGVDAILVDLGYASPTAIEVPERAADAGWFTPSRLPGEIGPSIIAGHVDLDGGAGVFFRLHELEAGDEVVVTGAEGATRTFEVTGSGQYPKDELPTEVFGFGEPVPELRLITCGGVFDPDEGHYRDNVVVYTRLVDA